MGTSAAPPPRYRVQGTVYRVQGAGYLEPWYLEPWYLGPWYLDPWYLDPWYLDSRYLSLGKPSAGGIWGNPRRRRRLPFLKIVSKNPSR